MPPVLRVKVISVYDVLPCSGLLLEHLVRLVVTRLQVLVEVEASELWTAVLLEVRGGNYSVVKN